MSSSNIINPKPCNYNCGTRIYWNTSENAYVEVFSNKRHSCPNRSKSVTQTTTANIVTSHKPTYHNNYKKSYFGAQVNKLKPKMSNSLEFLSGHILEIQKKYEILSDIVTEYNGKVHGSQRDRDPKTGLIDLLVYFEVPEGKREEVKQKFELFSKNEIKLYGKN
jgi:hypothetical protein